MERKLLARPWLSLTEMARPAHSLSDLVRSALGRFARISFEPVGEEPCVSEPLPLGANLGPDLSTCREAGYNTSP
jgi:hypothetical protein